MNPLKSKVKLARLLIILGMIAGKLFKSKAKQSPLTLRNSFN